MSGIGSLRRIAAVPTALLIAFTIALTTSVGSVLAAETIVFRDHSNTSGEADETNICGWPAHFDGHVTFNLVALDQADGTFHVNFHQTDNWTVAIADDPSVPASVRGETWRGRDEFTFVLNMDPSSQRVVQIAINPNSEGPFHGLLERYTLVVGADGTVRVENHEFVGEVDCSVFG
jgi:hypothetical protein